MFLTTLAPTDTVSRGLIPAAGRLGLDVALLTDRPDEHRAIHATRAHDNSGDDLGDPGDMAVDAVIRCDVRDPRAVIDTIARSAPRLGRPDAIMTNSDHIQPETALAASYFDVPGKDWRTCLTVKNKYLMRRQLAAAGVETVRSVVVEPDDDVPAGLPMPVVIKPREGVASEDVIYVDDAAAAPDVIATIRRRRPDAALVIEEYLPGPLRTLETLGDHRHRRIIGGFATTLGRLPHFVEERLDWCPDTDGAAIDHVLRALDALGVTFGACHTEYVLTSDGPRIVEVNYRMIGDTCDFLLADVTRVDLFAEVLRLHLGGTLPPSSAHEVGTDVHGAAVSLLAPTSGTVRAAPGDMSYDPADHPSLRGVRVVHRALRAVGDHVDVSHNNRDYLGIVRAVGPDRATVDAAIDTFRSEYPWVLQ